MAERQAVNLVAGGSIPLSHPKYQLEYMTEMLKPSEEPANEKLYQRFQEALTFPWDGNKTTIQKLIINQAKDTTAKSIAELTQNLKLKSYDLINRLKPRAESWQASKLLDHIWLWEMSL